MMYLRKNWAFILFLLIVAWFLYAHFSHYPSVDAAAMEKAMEQIKETERQQACIRATKNYYNCVKSRDPNSAACVDFGESDSWYFANYGEDILPACIPFRERVEE